MIVISIGGEQYRATRLVEGIATLGMPLWARPVQ